MFATCAETILLAEHISNDDRVHLGTMPITKRRNAYGRRLGSFSDTGDMGNVIGFPLEFIRAPYIESPDDSEVLTVSKDRAIAAGYGDQLVTAFHPELIDDARVHRYFLDMVEKRR